MKMHKWGFSLIAILAAPILAAQGQQAANDYTYPPMSHDKHLYYQQHPDEWQQLLEGLPRASRVVPPAKPGWRRVAARS